jgi:hypothetical protein
VVSTIAGSRERCRAVARDAVLALYERIPGVTVEVAGGVASLPEVPHHLQVPSGEYALSAALRRASVLAALAPGVETGGMEDPGMAFDAPLAEWPVAYLTRTMLLARAYAVPAVVWVSRRSSPDSPAERLLEIALAGATVVEGCPGDQGSLRRFVDEIARALGAKPQSASPSEPLLSPGQDARDLAESLREYVRFLVARDPLAATSGRTPLDDRGHGAGHAGGPDVGALLHELRRMHAMTEAAHRHQIHLLEALDARLTVRRMLGAPFRWIGRAFGWNPRRQRSG